MNFLIIGSTGFIGQALLKSLRAYKDFRITTVTREPLTPEYSEYNHVIPHFTSDTDWSVILKDIDVVIYLAGITNSKYSDRQDAFEDLLEVNSKSPINLARQASVNNVRRFIYLSTIKVNGEQSFDTPFTSIPSKIPTDPYGLSKFRAEQGLLYVSEQTKLEVVLIRPPLVYGPGVKGNMHSLMSSIDKGWPLPLGSVKNKRSLVSLDNLLSLIILCTTHKSAANNTFLVSDDQDISTPALITGLANLMGKPARLVPIPQAALVFAFSVLGKKSVADRVCGNLQVNISEAKDLLGWLPIVTLDESLKKMVDARNKHLNK